MKKIWSILLTFVLAVSVITPPYTTAAGALEAEISTADIQEVSAGQEYILVDAPVPGRKYIMTWNYEISGNAGKSYAIADNGSSVWASALDETYFNDDKSILTLPADVDASAYTWDVIWNQGSNPVSKAFLFQNMATGAFLGKNSSAVSVGNDPIGSVYDSGSRSSTIFSSYAWLYRDYQGYMQLAPYTDTERFLRYSVGTGNVKFGTTSVSTDVNNSHVYFYEKQEESSSLWQLVNSLESNEEYLIVSGNQAGDGQILTTAGRTVGSAEVTIQFDENTGATYIDRDADYNAIEVFHSYRLKDGTCWLDSWDDLSGGGVLRLDANALGVTGNHADYTYYNRFTFENGALSAYEGLTGAALRTVVYNNGFTVGNGNNVSIYKRVSQLTEPKEEEDDGKNEVIHGDGIHTPLSKLLTFSDYQKWTSTWTDDWETLQNQLTGICNGAYNAGADPDYMLFGGDFSCLNSATSSSAGMGQVLSILTGTWPQLRADRRILIQGNHDPADTQGISPTGVYYFDDFIIYVVNEDDFPTKQGSEEVLPGIEKTAGDLQAWLEERAAEGETRPIFIASHTSLHYDIDRLDGNNQYAYVMFDAINEAAEKLDIVFFFGHNHTNGDEQVGGSLTLFQKGDTLDVCTETSIADKKGTPRVINFTYMNYGYVGYIGDIYNNETEITPTDVLAVSLLSIYNDRIEVNRYSADGQLDEYSRIIQREHAPKPEDNNEEISKLSAKIAEAEAIETDSRELLDAIAEAKNLLAKGNATKDELERMLAKLESAVELALEKNENSGNENSGNENSGNENSGNENSGNENSGNENSGNENSGNENSGNENSGNENSGNENSGNVNPENVNPGNVNPGAENTPNYKGAAFTVNGIKYKVTSHTKTVKTVTVTGIKKSVKTVKIPAKVSYKKVSFKVTNIKKQAFKGKKSITKVTIGANVQSIGAKAFYGCKKLKTVTIKSKVLKKVGNSAFKKISSKAVIKVKKSVKKKYKNLLKGKIAAGVKIK